MFKVLGSTSANFIFAPIYRRGMLVAVHVKTGQITSSPFLFQLKYMINVAHQVPDQQPSANCCQTFEKIISSLSTSGP